jgi:hypothetical protein
MANGYLGVDTVDTISNTAKNFIDIGERLVKLPTNERQYYRTVLSETYRLLDNALLIPINRLSKILATSDKTVFVNELRLLEDMQEWRKIERDVNLCDIVYSGTRDGSGNNKVKGQVIHT